MSLKSRHRSLPMTCLTVVGLPMVVLAVLTWWQVQSASHHETLFAAIRRNDAAEVTALLNAGVDPNARDPETARGLSRADHIFAILNHDNRRENRQTPLLAALYRLRAPEPNTSEISANPNPNPAIIRALLDKGARVDATDATAMTTPLTFAILSGNTEIVGMLLQHGAKVNGEMGTPLICAAVQGRTDMMRFLLAHGADVNAQDMMGATALIATVRYARKPDSVRLLLDHHADVNRKDKAGKTALAYAQPTFGNLTSSQMIALLKHAGAR